MEKATKNINHKHFKTLNGCFLLYGPNYETVNSASVFTENAEISYR